jgi:hypothetical protein
MTLLNQLASQLDRKDEVPNVELAHELAQQENLAGIEEVIENLSNKDKKIQHDCIKVAYEIGDLKPELISKYALTFINLLKSRDNRLVWGGMSALASIADVSSDTIMDHLETVFYAVKNGSVITIDKGIITLAKLAAVNKQNNERIFPFLLQHLETCRSKEVPQHSESTLPAVTEDNKAEFLKVLKQREEYLSVAQLKRVKKIYKQLES